jgi:chromosomal replication initiation ATPase DnaA
MTSCDAAPAIPETLVTPREVIRAMIAAEAEAVGLTLADVLGPCRQRPIVRARHRAIRKVRAAYPAKSFPEIGRIFHRDHSTVIYALGLRRKASA